MSALVFSFLQIVPIFFLIGLGTVLRWRQRVSDSFLRDLSGLVFYVLIPPLLFLSIGETRLQASFDPRMIFPSLAGVLLFSVLVYALSGKYLSPSRQGVFVQGATRSNLVFVGLAVSLKLYGMDALGKCGVFIAFHALLINLLSVLFLILPHHSIRELTSWKRIAGQIVINPVIIGCAAGMIFASSGWVIPGVLRESLQYLSDATLPLALLIVGASLRWPSPGSGVGAVALATVLKLCVLPACIACLLRWAGASPQALLMSVIFLGAPTAAVSQIMAKEMEGDEELASSIVMATTFLSPFTLAAWISFLF
jgi:malonate transporter and related proteins